MRVLFDHQTFSLQDFGGISRYYTELISGIAKRPTDKSELSILFSENVYLKQHGFGVNSLPDIVFYKRRQMLYKINQFYTIKKLLANKFDVFHPTYYNPSFIPYLKDRPFVVTFLDMIHEKLSKQFPELSTDEMTTKYKKLLADRADKVIAISENTKRDIIDLLNINPDKIEVIYLGNSIKVETIEYKSEESLQPYLLFVGRREGYKNFIGLIKAIHTILKKYKLKLICAGGGAFSMTERALITSLNIDEYIEQQPVDDKTLQILYQQAVAFVFPSLYEGFGIPILEAFANNCPCIVSDNSSLPEVAGIAALYIDPLNEDSIRFAVEQILLNTSIRESLVEQGCQQLTNFSWGRTVEETVKIYHSIY